MRALGSRIKWRRRIRVLDAKSYEREKAEFGRLLALTDAERDAALARLADTDAELAAVLARRLRAAERPVASLDAPTADAPPRIARYRVLREIGRGGMGRVWLAERDDDGFRGQVAIKQLDREGVDDVEERRFAREREILAALDHPNIARLIDGGRDARGRPYLATWFVDGPSIDVFAERHALDLRACVNLLRKVGEAVAYAHRHLVIHRDIKPANILVDAEGEPRLLDFGIARLLDEQGHTTIAGAGPLTLRYASPEQILGQPAGVACDVHALGCLMYQLLAGEAPHAGVPAAGLTHAIVHDDPPAPSTVAARLGRAVPSRDLDAICLRALRKRPQDRYRSVDDWLADLDRALRGEPVEARRGERGYAARRFVARRWPWLTAALVVVGLLTYHVVSMNRQLAIVARERDRASELADFAITLYQSATPAEVREGRISAIALLDRVVERLEGESGASLDPGTRAALIASTGHVYFEIGLRERAARQFERAVNIFASIEPPPEDDLAEHQRYLAMALYGLGQPEQALAWIDRALARRAAMGDDDSLIMAGLTRAAAVYANSLDAQTRAAAYFDRAIAALERHLPDSGNELAVSLISAADLELQMGRLDRAQARIERAVALADPRVSTAYRTQVYIERLRGRLAFAQGNEREGLERMRESYEHARASMGADHPDVLIFAADYAALLTRAGRLDEAEPVFDHALAIGLAQGEGGARHWLGVRAQRARWLLARDRPAEAAKELADVLARRTQWPGRDRVNIAQERVALAFARCLTEDTGPDALLRVLAKPDTADAALRPGNRALFAKWRETCVRLGAGGQAPERS